MDSDFLVIGAGMAGASVGASLSNFGKVLILEREERPGYHTTGRSAAFFTTNYGNSTIRGLTEASRLFFENPPGDFSDSALMSAHGILTVAREDQSLSYVDSLAMANKTQANICEVDAIEAEKICPIMRSGYCVSAYFELGMYMDVNAIHQGFLRQLKRNGSTVLCSSKVLSLERKDGLWVVRVAGSLHSAPVLVNAAGAWADQLGALAGVNPIGLVPKRRTVILFGAPGELVPHDSPMVMDVDDEFYFKPESGKILASPADETPSEPCDAQPEELDVALTVNRVENAIKVPVGHIEHRWAGLRSFVADRTPVVGFDGGKDGFFWLAGQGGYGIMTSPAIAEAASALIMGAPWPSKLSELGICTAALAATRNSLQKTERFFLR